MKVTLKVVGRAYMTVDLPAGSEELLCSMRARLPGEFDDILFDLCRRRQRLHESDIAGGRE